MNYEAFPIVDYTTGLYTEKEAWLSPPDAFQTLKNAEIFRGRVEKRKGSTTVAYAVRRVGTVSTWSDGTDNVKVTLTSHGLSTGDYVVFQGVSGTGSDYVNDQRFFITVVDADNFTLDDLLWSTLGGTPTTGTCDLIACLTKASQISAITAANPAKVTTSSTHGLSSGDVVTIVEEASTPIVGMTEVLNCQSTITVLTSTTFTLDNCDSTNFEAYTSGGTVALVDIDADPIVGLHEFQEQDGSISMLVATTTRLSEFTGAINNATPISTSNSFSGSAGDYFQFSDYGGKAYMSNFVDRPFVWDGSTLSQMTIDIDGDTSNDVSKARIIIPYKQRMLLLNTTESSVNYPQRVRWTAQLTQPSATLDWVNGDAVDASTTDQIVGYEFLKGILIVYFDNSVWSLKDTGSKEKPFRWERIDSLSTRIDAPFSVIGHQNSVWAFGLDGWVLTDSQQVQDFATPIPDFEEQISDDQKGLLYSEANPSEKQIWTAYPTEAADANNRVLVYNTENGSFSEYDHAYNVATTFHVVTAGVQLADIDEPLDSLDVPLNSFATRAGFPEYWTGTGCGELRRMNDGSSDDGANIDMELLTSRLVPYKDSKAQLGWVDFLITENSVTSITVDIYTDWVDDPILTRTLTIDSSADSVDKLMVRMYCNVIGQSFRFRITNNAPLEPYQQHAMIPYFRRSGRLV